MFEEHDPVENGEHEPHPQKPWNIHTHACLHAVQTAEVRLPTARRTITRHTEENDKSVDPTSMQNRTQPSVKFAGGGCVEAFDTGLDPCTGQVLTRCRCL